MTTYSENWSGETDAVYPTALTKRWNTGDETVVAANADTEAEAAFSFEQEWSVAARRLNSWDVVEDGNELDIELVCRFQINETAQVDFNFNLQLRGSGGAGSEVGYQCSTVETTTNDLELSIAEVGVITIASSGTILFDIVSGEWLWIRFRANGINPTTLQAKMWRDGDPEPSAWAIDDNSNSGIDVAGWNGTGCGIADANSAVDYFGGGTNGDTAPIIGGVGTDLRLTAAYAASLQTGTPDIRITAAYAAVLYKIFKPRTHQTVVAVIGTGSED
jgi:hypothetical protein